VNQFVEHRRVRSFDGTCIAYRLHGNPDGPWLVLTNGAGCSEHYFTGSLIPTLRERFRILEWNYRGHYDSEPAPHKDAYRVEDHAGDVQALLDAEGITDAVFLGFSLGVQVVLETYRQRPAPFRALALINGSYEDPLSSMWGTPKVRPILVFLLELLARHPGFTGAAVNFAMGGPIALPFAKLNRFCEDNVPDEVMRPYLKKVAHINPVAYMRTLRLMGEHSAGDVLAGVAEPTLIVAGPEDTMTPIEKMEQIRDAIPDNEYHVLEGGRHTLLMTSGDWIGRTLLEFLDRRGVLAEMTPAATPEPKKAKKKTAKKKTAKKAAKKPTKKKTAKKR